MKLCKLAGDHGEIITLQRCTDFPRSAVASPAARGNCLLYSEHHFRVVLEACWLFQSAFQSLKKVPSREVRRVTTGSFSCLMRKIQTWSETMTAKEKMSSTVLTKILQISRGWHVEEYNHFISNTGLKSWVKMNLNPSFCIFKQIITTGSLYHS